MEARVVDELTPAQAGSVEKILGHREFCRLPIADVAVVIAKDRATLVIQHFVFSRGRKHPKLCYVDIA